VGATAASPAGTSPPTGGPRFGIVDSGMLTDTPARLVAALADAASLGVTDLREQLSWNATEPSPGVYRWAAFDRVVRAAAAHHLRMLVLVDFTPSWARPADCGSWTCAPADPGRFASFAGVAAARYAPYGVHDWEIWNEPNAAAFWQPRPDAASYTRLLTATAHAIRSADPHAFVVSGGLAPEPDARGDVDGPRFLSGVCRAGGLAAVDAVGVHPYSYPVPPGYRAQWSGWSQMASTSVSERSVMTGCGAGAKPLWATEYGAPTNGPGAAASPQDYNLAAHPDHVTEALQAELATDSVDAAAGSPWLGALFWYSRQDLGLAPTTVQNFFGMRRYDGSAKPALAALRSAIARVRSGS
jgi:hypothetical protein